MPARKLTMVHERRPEGLATRWRLEEEALVPFTPVVELTRLYPLKTVRGLRRVGDFDDSRFA